MMEIFDRIYLGNTVEQWLISAGILLVAFIVITGVLRFIGGRVKKLASRTESRIDDLAVDLLQSTRWYVVFVWSASIAMQWLDGTAAVFAYVPTIVVLFTLLQTGIWGNRIIGYWIGRVVEERMAKDSASATTMAGVRFVARLVLFTLIVLLALDNIGIDITAAVTGLGIGGIAVALALQNILGDLFASLSIVLDRPFQIGDFIVIGEYMGTVEYIGLKTTRIRSLSGEQIVFSNADLLSSRIRNYKRMAERRVVFTIGVTYQTPAEKLRALPNMLREITEKHAKVRFDRAHFKSYGDSALIFEIVYYVLSGDYAEYMDIQQTINLDLYSRCAKEGIEFAYPTRTLFVTREDTKAG